MEKKKSPMALLTEERYQALSAFWQAHPAAGRAVKQVNQILTGAVYLAYPAMLLYLFVTRDERLVRCILIPGISFALVSLLRKAIGARRPYEVYGGTPLIQKDTVNNSFPSRHVFSVFVIGMTGFYLHPALGGILFVIGVFLAVVRVLGGVHFPKDVAAGAGLGILAGLLFLL
ncbi:MAG: phosphatase PAP2 family protein [Lachnospiraceae bacterium]|nr:phosphatase PAP2 family protein [Lachnospiraceae bacterium]